jgi:hypothetical protein
MLKKARAVERCAGWSRVESICEGAMKEDLGTVENDDSGGGLMSAYLLDDKVI